MGKSKTSTAGNTAGGPSAVGGDDDTDGFVPVRVGPCPDDWAAVDDGLPVDVLGARICALATRMAQATFHWLQMIAEFDRREGWAGVGIRSCAHWLAWTCSMAAGTAREHVRVARALQRLPLVADEMSAGRLSYAKVREITRVAGSADEARLVEFARTATASQLARTIRGFRRADGSRARQEQRRHARWWVDDDGTVLLSARLPAEEGAAVIAALEAARDDLIRLSRRQPEGPSGNTDGAIGEATDGAIGDEPIDTDPTEDAASDTHTASVAGATRDRKGTTHHDASTACDGRGGDDCGSTAPCPPVDPADMLLQWARGYLSASPEDRSGEDRTMVVVHVNAERLLPDSDGAERTDEAGSGGGREFATNPEPGTNPESASDAQSVNGSGSPDDSPCTDSAHHIGTPASLDRPRSRGNAATDLTTPHGALDRSAIPLDCCQVAGVAGITADTAARVACDAAVIGVIRGIDGAVLAHGRRRRTVSAAQRRLLTIRDGGCMFPSCTRTSHLEAHHVRHWMHGGRTDPDNLILLCRFHHMACHEGGVVISHTTDSTPSSPRWRFATREGDALRGNRFPSGAPGWKHDEWILWHDLDGSQGWRDPEAERIRPLWAGERFSLADAVAALFDPRSPTDEPDASGTSGSHAGKSCDPEAHETDRVAA